MRLRSSVAYLAMGIAMGLMVGAWGLKDGVLKRKWWLLPFSGALVLLVWTISLFRSRIEWRGVSYTVDTGRLIRKASEADREATLVVVPSWFSANDRGEDAARRYTESKDKALG